MTTTILNLIELDHRKGDGLEVWLLWDGGSGQTFIRYRDSKTAETRAFEIPNDKAKEAFDHPFVFEH